MINEQDKIRDEIIIILQTLHVENRISKTSYDNLHDRIKKLSSDKKEVINEFIKDIIKPENTLHKPSMSSPAQITYWIKQFDNYIIEIRKV